MYILVFLIVHLVVGSTTTRFFTLYTYNIYGQHHIASSLVLKPVGSARLTFDDDLYYELCGLMYRSLFGVPGEITDMTRSLEMVET